MATPPPSQFAALLRQSKFASFDPKIGQAYASFGGHAHRGNWGLKRPLPLRRRKGVVTVSAIDSREQQTEWKSAEPQSRWIQMWEEVGITPELGNRGWAEKLGMLGDIQWDLDSEFTTATKDPLQDDRGTKEELDETSYAVPNIMAMTDSEFERYLEELRELRPAFREYIQEKEGGKHSLWENSFQPGDLAQRFLGAQAKKKYNAPGARIIEQQPQRYGGLTYAQSPPLQTRLLTHPRQGRLLQFNPANTRSGSIPDYVASFAGMTHAVNKNAHGSGNAMDWSSLISNEMRNPGDGVTNLRLKKAILTSPPKTVGRHPRGLESTKMMTEAYAEVHEHSISNPHIPGSREYTAADPPQTRSMLNSWRKTSRKSTTATFKGTYREKHLVDLLKNLVEQNAAARRS